MNFTCVNPQLYKHALIKYGHLLYKKDITFFAFLIWGTTDNKRGRNIIFSVEFLINENGVKQ